MCVHHALSSKVWGGCNVLPLWIIDSGGLNSLTRAQAGDLGDSWLNWIIFLIMIAVLNIYGSRLQVQMWMNQIARALTQLQQLTKEASNTFLQEASKLGGDGESAKQVLEEVKGFFTIQPVTLDPTGAIRRLENILDNAKDMLDRFVERAAPKADKVKKANLRDQLQGVIVLDLIFRIVRHFYLLGKKTQNWIYIAQVQMQLPEIMRIARAYWRSSAAFQKGVPVGDSVGPLVALRLIGDSPIQELAEDVVVGETEIALLSCSMTPSVTVMVWVVLTAPPMLRFVVLQAFQVAPPSVEMRYSAVAASSPPGSLTVTEAVKGTVVIQPCGWKSVQAAGLRRETGAGDMVDQAVAMIGAALPASKTKTNMLTRLRAAGRRVR